MADPTLKYCVTSPEPGRIVELRDQLAQATDPQSLLAAAYVSGKVVGADFWAAASIDHPCHYVWFHSRMPLSREALQQQTADLNRQAGLARSRYVDLPVMIFQPQPEIATEQHTADPLAAGPAQHRDFHIWSAQTPRALVRVGSCLLPDELDYEALQAPAELLGLHLSTVLSRPDSVEGVEIVGSGEKLDQETFFQCLELALAEVHRRAGELSLLTMEIKVSSKASGNLVSGEDWHYIWEQLNSELRRTDLIAQMDSGCYVIAMPLTSPHDALIVADRIRAELEQLADERLMDVKVVMGISTWSAGRPGIGQLLWEAREAMHMANDSGASSAFIYA